MQRKAMVIGIKPECIEEYKRYHSDPWPEVLECISEGNVKNFYASLNSGSKIKFSVANAIDTSEIEINSQIELGFDINKSIILPKGALATE